MLWFSSPMLQKMSWMQHELSWLVFYHTYPTERSETRDGKVRSTSHHESTCVTQNPLSDFGKWTKMSHSLLLFHGPDSPLTYTEACQKCSPRRQYIGVNEKRIKQWIKTVVGFRICSPFSACCDLCTELLLGTVGEEILTLLKMTSLPLSCLKLLSISLLWKWLEI